MQPLSDKPAPPPDEQGARGAVEWLLQFASRYKAVSEYLEAQ